MHEIDLYLLSRDTVETADKDPQGENSLSRKDRFPIAINKRDRFIM